MFPTVMFASFIVRVCELRERPLRSSALYIFLSAGGAEHVIDRGDNQCNGS